MTRLTLIDPTTATGRAKELLDTVAKRHGKAANLTRVMAHSPAVLDAYLGFGAALGKGLLSPKIRHQIAIAVGEVHHCDYCVAAHTMIGKAIGLDADELHRARSGKSSDVKAAAALEFALRVVERRGDVEDVDIDELRAAGFTDGEIVEIVAHVAFNTLTNYINHVAGTPIDFPAVPKLEP